MMSFLHRQSSFICSVALTSNFLRKLNRNARSLIMRFVLILVAAMAYAVAALPTTNSGQPVENDDIDGMVKRTLASGSGNQNTANAVVRKRRITIIETNGQVLDLDDDDLRIATTDLTGRRIAFESKQNPVPIRIPVRSSFQGPVFSVGQATGDIVFVSSGDSKEIDDLNDLAIITTGGQTFPFAFRQNAVRFVPRSLFFDPLMSPITVASQQTRMKSGLANAQRASSTCNCPSQRETVNISSQFSSRARSRLMQFVRSPRQRYALSSLPVVKFVFDD